MQGEGMVALRSGRLRMACHTFAYDAVNRVKSADGSNNLMSYDGDGRRVENNETGNIRLFYTAHGHNLRIWVDWKLEANR